ncbi:Aste57867_12946 [Aphanomyces stellatus]|uniref:Aste57867_12946 protein n=1 Tax=Aphanomyces stellatus TaxID=120398 RepID=A0A485KWW4_9STRA|nr:hypothetical protein As57867_012898 [Aphanomyces stellatus]VFT89792.1 Aste57867_12946 [Aphanomyces stellatus]
MVHRRQQTRGMDPAMTDATDTNEGHPSNASPWVPVSFSVMQQTLATTLPATLTSASRMWWFCVHEPCTTTAANDAQGSLGRDGHTFLHCLFAAPATSEADCLLALQARPPAWPLDTHARSTGETLLHVAARRGFAFVVQSLLQLGACSSHAAASRGPTPLHVAAAAGHRECVRHLATTADAIDALDDQQQSAIALAMANMHADVVTLLMARDAIVDTSIPAVSRWCRWTRVPPDDVAALIRVLPPDADRMRDQLLAWPRGVLLRQDDAHGATPLHLLAVEARAAVLLPLAWPLLHHHGYAIDERTFDLETPLLWAASAGVDAAILVALLAAGADVDAVDRLGHTALLRAAAAGHMGTTQQLLQAGAQVNWVAHDGCTTAVSLAATHKHRAIAQCLVRAGAIPTADDDTVLAWPLVSRADMAELLARLKAASTMDAGLLRALWTLDDVCVVDMDGFTLLHWMAGSSPCMLTREVLDWMVQSGYAIDELGGRTRHTPLHWAVRIGDARAVTLLLDAGASPHAVDNNHDTPLHYAVAGDALDVAELLVARGANVSAVNLTHKSPLHVVAETNKLHFVDALRQSSWVRMPSPGSDAGDADGDPIHVAARLGLTKMVVALATADGVNAKTLREGLTPLHLAVHGGHVSLVQTLLTSVSTLRVNEPTTGATADTALHMAVAHGHFDLVRLLVEVGNADMDVPNGYHNTPLSLAVHLRLPRIVRWLLDAGADMASLRKATRRALVELGVDTTARNTPLHVAAAKGNIEELERLLDDQEDVHARNMLQKTPLHVAASQGHLEAYQLLRHFRYGDANRDKGDDDASSIEDDRRGSGKTKKHKTTLARSSQVSSMYFGPSAVAAVPQENTAEMMTNADGLLPLECLIRGRFIQVGDLREYVPRGGPAAERVLAPVSSAASHAARIHWHPTVFKALIKHYPTFAWAYLDLFLLHDKSRRVGEAMFKIQDMDAIYGVDNVETSALALLVTSVSDNVDQRLATIKVLLHPILQRVLELKWKSFGRQVFFTKSIEHFALLVCGSFSTVLNMDADAGTVEFLSELFLWFLVVAAVVVSYAVVRSYTSLLIHSIRRSLARASGGRQKQHSSAHIASKIQHLTRADESAFHRTLVLATTGTALGTAIVATSLVGALAGDTHAFRKAFLVVNKIAFVGLSLRALCMELNERRQHLVPNSLWACLEILAYSLVVGVTWPLDMGWIPSSSSDASAYVSSVVVLLLWVISLQYFKMHRVISPMVTMIDIMLHDVGRFFAIYGLFHMGLTCAYYSLFRGHDGFETFWQSFLSVYIIMFGQLNTETVLGASGIRHVLAALFLMMYYVAVSIVLLNVLIAIMTTHAGRILERVQEEAEYNHASSLYFMELKYKQSMGEVLRRSAPGGGANGDPEAVKRRAAAVARLCEPFKVDAPARDDDSDTATDKVGQLERTIQAQAATLEALALKMDDQMTEMRRLQQAHADAMQLMHTKSMQDLGALLAKHAAK